MDRPPRDFTTVNVLCVFFDGVNQAAQIRLVSLPCRVARRALRRDPDPDARPDDAAEGEGAERTPDRALRAGWELVP